VLSMKLFFILSSLLSVTVAQTISCRYVNYGSVYGCELTISNPNNFNSFTQITGNHLSGYSNARVGHLARVGGITSNTPRIICDTFPNLVQVDLHNTGMLEVDDNAFRGCSLITQLDLWENRISSISVNAFATLRNVQFLNLEKNALSTLPANVFANQQNLQMLYLSQNLFADFPVGIFRPLGNILNLGLGFSNLVEINTQWFGNNTRLVDLHVGGNRIRLTPQSFVGLDSLRYLNLGNNGLTTIPAGTFANLRNLRDLDIYYNAFTELVADQFTGLTNLAYLQIGYAPIQKINANTFRGLTNLKTLMISFSQLTHQQVSSAAFEGLPSLNYLDLSYNNFEEISNFLVPLSNLHEVSFKNNYLRTIRRSNFGTVTSLDALDLDGNMITAFEKSLLDAAVNFNSLFFYNNVCASRFFASFTTSRAEYLPFLQTCFNNYVNLADNIE